MEKKVFFLISAILVLVSVNALYSQSHDRDLSGIWSVYKVTIEKNIDDESITTTYNSDISEINSFVPCPSEFLISTDEIIFKYPDGAQELGKYFLEDNILKIHMDVALIEYQYEILDSGKIILYYITDYIIDGVHNVEESYTFYLEQNH